MVDDVISAGSSVRATVAALAAAGASTIVVGALLVLGDAALIHFAEQDAPFLARFDGMIAAVRRRDIAPFLRPEA